MMVIMIIMIATASRPRLLGRLGVYLCVCACRVHVLCVLHSNKIDTISYHRIAWHGRANLPKKPRSKRVADGNP